jgi:tellurite resistance protein
MVANANRQERSRALGSTLPADLAASASVLRQSSESPSDPGAVRLHALLEVAYLAAAADGVLADDEINLLVTNLHSWLGEELPAAFLVELFEHLGQQLAKEGYQARLDALAKILDRESRLVAYRLACVTALVDHDVHDDELRVLERIVDAFHIPNTEAQALFDALDEAITGM